MVTVAIAAFVAITVLGLALMLAPRAKRGQPMAVPYGPPQFTIEVIRDTNKGEVLCGMRALERDDEPRHLRGGLGLYIDAFAAAQIEQKLGADHNRHRAGRVVALTVGKEPAGKLVQFTPDGKVKSVRATGPVLLVELA